MRVFMTLSLLGLTTCAMTGVKERKRDAFSELNAKRAGGKKADAGLALRFFDALTGKPLVGAKVRAKSGAQTTDAEGRVLLPWPADLNRREDRRTVRVSRKVATPRTKSSVRWIGSPVATRNSPHWFSLPLMKQRPSPCMQMQRALSRGKTSPASSSASASITSSQKPGAATPKKSERLSTESQAIWTS